MKISVSLSDRVAEHAATLASTHDSNVSTVVESALKRFVALPEADRAKAIREAHASKRALTRSGWMAVFWDALAEEFDCEDFARGNSDQVMIFRKYDGFGVVFLMNRAFAPDTESDPLIVHIFETPSDSARSHQDTKFYKQEDSVYDAARATARWIMEHRQAKSGN